MKKEIRRKIKTISDGIGSAAAKEEAERLILDLEAEYDKNVSSGMSELDAYRKVLINVEAIEDLLRNMPRTDAEIERDDAKKRSLALQERLHKISTVMWLSTVVLYFLFSLTFGYWHLSWLIFLYAAIGQITIGMVQHYNSGTSLKKTVRDGLTAILWLSTVIAYFIISFTFGHWHLTWLIFILALIVQIILPSFTKE